MVPGLYICIPYCVLPKTMDADVASTTWTKLTMGDGSSNSVNPQVQEQRQMIVLCATSERHQSVVPGAPHMRGPGQEKPCQQLAL